MTETVSVTLTPAEQGRDWRRRWTEVQQDVNKLSSPERGEMSADAVHSVSHRLQSLFIQTYHLKDALKVATPSHGISPSEIERAISSDGDLALLADLANLDKHGNLDRPPRSGHVPKVLSAEGTSDPASQGWRLTLSIAHAETVRDGIEVAQAAVEAWRRHLTNWGLI